jgi:hypothetical protein
MENEQQFAVWEHLPTGRVLHVFDDEFLAQRFAVMHSATYFKFTYPA